MLSHYIRQGLYVADMKKHPLPNSTPTPLLATEPGSWTVMDGQLVPTPEPSEDAPQEEPGALLVIPPATAEPPTLSPEF